MRPRQRKNLNHLASDIFFCASSFGQLNLTSFSIYLFSVTTRYNIPPRLTFKSSLENRGRGGHFWIEKNIFPERKQSPKRESSLENRGRSGRFWIEKKFQKPSWEREKCTRFERKQSPKRELPGKVYIPHQARRSRNTPRHQQRRM